MIRAILAAALLALLPLAPAAAESPVVGTYRGTVHAGGADLPVETRFSEQGGVLAGTYTVEDPAGAFSGTLGEIDLADNGVYTMTWTDRDGSGGATMAFTPDGQAFVGKWYIEGAAQGFWNGTKTP